jgi:hypothetical protein
LLTFVLTPTWSRPLPKKAKQDLRHLTQDDSDIIRKLLAASEKQPPPIPSLIFPLPSPFANFRPHANMEPFPAKKAKQNLRQLTHDDSFSNSRLHLKNTLN